MDTAERSKTPGSNELAGGLLVGDAVCVLDFTDWPDTGQYHANVNELHVNVRATNTNMTGQNNL